jgi:hypothetical protein
MVRCTPGSSPPRWKRKWLAADPFVSRETALGHGDKFMRRCRRSLPAMDLDTELVSLIAIAGWIGAGLVLAHSLTSHLY